MNSFYVILPSNTPVDGNRTANYTVRLPNTLDLSEGDWTVALSSMIYPVSYHSDNIEEMWVMVEYYDTFSTAQTENLSRDRSKPRKIIIPNAIFKSVKHMEKTINDTISSQKGLNFSQDTISLPNKGQRVRRGVVVEPFDMEPNGSPTLTDQKIKNDRSNTRTNANAEIPKPQTQEEKALNSARHEVIDRSFSKMLNLVDTIKDEISDIEGIIARVEEISEITDIYFTRVNQEYDKFELEAIKNELNTNKNKANELREDAQAQRTNIRKHELAYEGTINQIDQKFTEKDLKNSKTIANRAKNIVIQLQGLKHYISGKKEEANGMLKKARDKKEALHEGIEIIEPGMKANMDRIKKIILSEFTLDQQINTDIYFYYDDNLGKFFLFNNQPKKVKNVRLSKHLAYLMGFEIEPADGSIKGIRMRRGGGFAKYTPDISGGIHQLYVYMPRIIDHTYLGNIQVPLLRIINVEKEPGHIAENIYTQEYHHKIIEKRISSIQIEIRSSTGELIKFNWGDVIVTLHFRRSLF
jgi:hypothetical protein